MAAVNQARSPGVTGLMEAFWEQVQKDLGCGCHTRLDERGALVPKDRRLLALADDTDDDADDAAPKKKKRKSENPGLIAISTFRFLHSEDFETWALLSGADPDVARAHLLSSYWTGPIPLRNAA